MDYLKINKCVKNSLARLKPRRCQMSMYSYLNYFCRRNEISFEENLYIRKCINKYLKKNEKNIYNVDFTINGKAC